MSYEKYHSRFFEDFEYGVALFLMGKRCYNHYVFLRASVISVNDEKEKKIGLERREK